MATAENADRPAKPDPLAVKYEQIPPQLKRLDCWVAWRYVWKSDREKWTKIPIDVSRDRRAKSNDPETWSPFDTAREYHENPDTDSDGLGVMFHPEDTVVGIDLDDVRDPETGSPDPVAKEIVNTAESFTEVSPSGTGYHVYLHGMLPAEGKRRNGEIEIYEDGRYFTVTGHHVEGTPPTVNRRNESLQAVHQEYVADESDDTDRENRVNKPADTSAPSDLSDQKLIEKAKNAEYGEEFTALWNGRTSGYESHSEADYALCQHLLFWTGGDRDRAADLFAQSGLDRQKWDREDYRKRTLRNADRNISHYYDPEEGTTDPPAYTDPPERANDTNAELTPEAVARKANLDYDEEQTLAEAIAGLNDREKAAVVWELLKESEEYHIRVRRETGELYACDNGVWKPEGERTLRHAGRQALGSTNYGTNVVTELTTQATSDPQAEIPSETLGLDPGVVAVENGLVDLSAAASGEDDALRPLRPGDYALTRLPVEYDPEAWSDEWVATVTECVEEGKQAAFQEYVGYTLHRGAMPAHKALLLVGDGSNGKSTVLNVIRALLGSDNTRAKAIHDFAKENHVADLHGKIANINPELSEGSLSATGVSKFKTIIGGDTVEGRHMYEESFAFHPTAKHLYACNTTPELEHYVDSEDTAWWRRWLIIHFPRHFTEAEKDPTLQDRLTRPTALSGILNWAIEGWGRLRENGFQFTNDDTLGRTRDRWVNWGENVDKFINTCVDPDPDAENLSTKEAWRVYRAWCQENGEEPVGQRKFTQALKNGTADVRYKQRVRPHGTGQPTNGYKALGLTDDAPDIRTVLDYYSQEEEADESGDNQATTMDDYAG